MESPVQFCAGSMMAKYRDEGKIKNKHSPNSTRASATLHFCPSPVEDLGHHADIK